MVAQLKRLWNRGPARVRRNVYRATAWTGVPYLVSFLTGYGSMHAAANFAGNLPELKAAYRRSSGKERDRLGRRINAVANALVLPNGVRRTTYPDRHNDILATILDDERCRIDKSAVRVLDIPSANGVASLGSFDALSQRYCVSRYVLGDLLTRTLHDQDRDSIFDDAHNLLQIRRGRRFFSLYRAHKSGKPFGRVARIVLFPLEIVSWWLKRRFPFPGEANLTPIRMVHPDVEARLGEGVFELETMNVFAPIRGEYDVILSFNLLQRNYFPAELIARGTENLGRALAEGGLLVLGSPDTGGVSPYIVLRKCGAKLVVVKKHGEF